MAKSQSLVMVGRHCDDGVLNLFIIEQKTKQKQLELKTDYNNNTRYSFDINNIQRSWRITKKQNIKPGEIYKWK